MCEQAELDSVDWHILEELQNDATIPNRTLAEIVGLAPSSCLQRVRRLRELGVITGCHAVVDPATTGLPRLIADITARYAVTDLSIVEPDLEQVIGQIYEAREVAA